jgi:hypothetical protein
MSARRERENKSNFTVRSPILGQNSGHVSHSIRRPTQ